MNDRELLSARMRRTTGWTHVHARDQTLTDMPHIGAMLYVRVWYNVQNARVIVAEFDVAKKFFAARMYNAENGLAYDVRDDEIAGALLMREVLEWIGESNVL